MTSVRKATPIQDVVPNSNRVEYCFLRRTDSKSKTIRKVVTTHLVAMLGISILLYGAVTWTL